MEKQLTDLIKTYPERSELQDMFNAVIAHSQGFDLKDIQSTVTLNTWARNKNEFYQCFGYQLICNCGHVETNLSFTAKKAMKKDFCLWLGRHRKYESSSCWRRLYEYIMERSVDEFFNNALETDVQITNSNNEVKTITKGTKLLRSFRSFFPEDWNTTIREVQDKASEYIQQTKIEGELCLSIHPLDFLSLSENDAGWRSCHSLNGDYRAGNLSYMMDNATVIAYIKSPEDREIPRFPFKWNSKKWRTLIFLNRDKTMAFAGRSYPFDSYAALKLVAEAFEKRGFFYLFQDGWKFNQLTGLRIKKYDSYADDYYYSDLMDSDTELQLFDSYYNRCIFDSTTGSFTRIVDLMWETDSNCCHYNDLLFSSTYFPHYALGRGEGFGNKKKSFEIGHEVYCLLDEDHVVAKDCSHRLICEDCINRTETEFSNCDLCRHSVEETLYVDYEDQYVCQECWDACVCRCEHCGVNMYDYHTKILNEKSYCLNCYDDKIKKENEDGGKCE